MTKRNWITKSEEKQIITAYEGFKGEIIPAVKGTVLLTDKTVISVQ